jgi:CheY-like chemotaxis protein
LDELSDSAQPGILVVEEDDAVRNLIGLTLRQHGLSVWLAASGQEAWELFHRNRQAIAVVLLDVGMKTLDGPQTLAALRSVRPDLRCCFMTGGIRDYTKTELLGMGAFRVFAKPFVLNEMAETLRNLALLPERRLFPRFTHKQLRLLISEGPPGGAGQEAWLRDRSRGGMSIVVPRSVSPGALLTVRAAHRPETGAGMQVLVKHCRPEEGNWLLGCQLQGEPGAELPDLDA